MMPELVCHLLGDYVLQNNAMARNKTSSWFWATLHALTYALPFLTLTRSAAALAVIVGTHALVDRYRLAGYWTRFWGVGCEGSLCAWWRWYYDHEYLAVGHPLSAFGPTPEPPATPDFLAVWLMIIVDNTLHLLVNHLSLAYLA